MPLNAGSVALGFANLTVVDTSINSNNGDENVESASMVGYVQNCIIQCYLVVCYWSGVGLALTLFSLKFVKLIIWNPKVHSSQPQNSFCTYIYLDSSSIREIE